MQKNDAKNEEKKWKQVQFWWRAARVYLIDKKKKLEYEQSENLFFYFLFGE